MNNLKNEVFETCNKLGIPYIYALPIILREAFTRGCITDLSDDGINEKIISDNEY